MFSKKGDKLKCIAITSHAKKRMQNRGINGSAIEAVLDFGRVLYTRGATLYVIGRREIDKEARHGNDLKEFDGIHVVCAKDGAVITTYRNKSFRGAREGLGEKRHFPMKRFYAEISI